MNKLRIMCVLVAMAFCLGITDLSFAGHSPIGGLSPDGRVGGVASSNGLFDYGDSSSKKPSKSYKAPKTTITCKGNNVTVSKGRVEKQVKNVFKGLNKTQKNELKKYIKNIQKSKEIKKLNKQYKKKPSTKKANKIVNTIAKKIKTKSNSMKKKKSTSSKHGYNFDGNGKKSDRIDGGTTSKDIFDFN